MRVTAAEALLRLRDGNGRFREVPSAGGRLAGRGGGFLDLSAAQEPFAAVLGCSDARVPVEVLFDQGPGQLFVVRVAGNVAGPTQMASLEFAVEEIGVPLILILGHTHCGAVTAALTPPGERKPWMASEHLDHISRRISRVLEGLGSPMGSRTEDLIEKAARLNVRASGEDLLKQSGILASRARSGKLRIVGSIYHLKTGRVEFFL